MSGWFLGHTGQWYSGAERAAMSSITKKARSMGVPEAQYRGVCNRCAQDQGKVSHHNHDYSHPWKYLEELCWMCHQVVHAQVYAPAACDKYWRHIQAGGKSQPFDSGGRWPALNLVWPVMRSKWGIYRPRGYGKITPPPEVLALYDAFERRQDRADMFLPERYFEQQTELF